MQTVSSEFTNNATADFREISWKLSAAFDKDFDSSVDFFLLDSSILDGNDILAPSDSSVISQWDKYTYTDYSDRVISLEITREESDPYSAVLAYADITLNNYDNYFTPNGGSPIQDLILPKRPFRIFLGFNGENIPQFVGINEKMPVIDKTARTVSFHLIDFLSYLYDQDISATVTLQNVTTADIFDYLFQLMGLLPSQYSLDYSFNHIDFFYVEKGQSFGDIVSQLLEAEMGRLYLDESGVIYFKNKYNYSLTPSYTFDKSNTNDYTGSGDTLIKNHVKINSNVLEVQPLQSVWSLSQETTLEPGKSVDIWADSNDPLTSLDSPVYSQTDIGDSYFSAVTNDSSRLPYSDITLSGFSTFSKSAKMTFQNTGSGRAVINIINLWGTPAKAVDTISVEEVNQDSIDKYDDQIYEITNNYIQNEDNAISRALIILQDYAEYETSIDIDVKGTPALQISDINELDIDGFQGLYKIQRIINTYANNRFSQRIKLKAKTLIDLFILDQSLLDSTDLLAP